MPITFEEINILKKSFKIDLPYYPKKTQSKAQVSNFLRIVCLWTRTMCPVLNFTTNISYEPLEFPSNIYKVVVSENMVESCRSQDI